MAIAIFNTIRLDSGPATTYLSEIVRTSDLLIRHLTLHLNLFRNTGIAKGIYICGSFWKNVNIFAQWI